MSSQLRQIKAKALSERKNKSSNNENADACFYLQLKESSLHPRIIKQARKTGVLNLSNRGISEMPDIVWNLNSLSSEESKALSLSLESNEDDRWWECVDLTKLILASNSLTDISSKISNYPALTVLDLHDNLLLGLPLTLGTLRNLTKLNISRNKFESIPECVFQLKSLKCLQVQQNELKSLHDDIGNLSFLEELDLSCNHIKRIPPCFGFLSRLINLNFSNNDILKLPVEVGDLIALKTIDVSKNKLKELPESIEMLRHLEQLYVQHNSLSSIPLLSSCLVLKEIHAGYNNIQELSAELIETIRGVKILDVRDNKITEISDNVYTLQSLERLDVSNNSLSNLPYTLGTLPHLKYLSIEGNPMKSIRRDVIQRGTVQLLKWLRSRIEDPSALNLSQLSVDSSVCLQSSAHVDKYSMKSTKTLTLSNQNLHSVNLEILEMAAEANVTIVDLSKNLLTEIPDQMKAVFPRLTELNMSYNRLSSVPTFIGIATNLQFLDLRNNQLNSLPDELRNVSCLREINLAFNRFTSIPGCLYELKKLEILIASDNQIEEMDVTGLLSLSVLSVLDLHNNSIKVVPAELGNMKQIRSLLLDGNLFRNPRPAILSKGTPALLEFLQSRIPQM